MFIELPTVVVTLKDVVTGQLFIADSTVTNIVSVTTQIPSLTVMTTVSFPAKPASG
jgi:hypothetical protein